MISPYDILIFGVNTHAIDLGIGAVLNSFA
jgi:hypothetical protein